MTERSPAERPAACPFLAFDDDRDYRSDRPDHRHRCFAEAHPAPRAISHQELFCIGGAFGECPTFLAWAAREAATVRRPTVRRGEAPGATRAAAERSPYAQPAVPVDRDWQAPPPWMAGAAAAAGTGAEGAYSQPDDADAYEPPAFLAGRTSRPGTGATAGGATAGATAGGAAAGPAAAGPTPAGPTSGGAAAGPSAAPAAGRGGDEVAGYATASGVSSASLIGGSGAAHPADDDLSGLVSDEEPPYAPTGGAYAPYVPPSAAAGAAAGATRPAPQPMTGRSGGAYASRPPASGRGSSSDALWVQPDDDIPAEDEAWEDPIEAAAAARIARNAQKSGSSSRFGLGRSRSPSTGQARPQPQRAADPAAPSWERPRRFEAYPAIKSGSGGGGSRRIPRIAIWLGLLAIAALALFLIPPMLLGGGSGGSGATPSPSAPADASPSVSLAPTPVPLPTPFVYKVKQGDTLSGIAAKYKVSVNDLLSANPDMKDPNQLQIGDKLVIPLPASSVIPDAGTPDVAPADTTAP